MLFALIGLAVAVRMLKITLAQLWRAAWAPLFATAGMTLVLVAAERSIASPWPALITGGLLGGATYFALMWLFARDALERLWEMARPVSPPELSTDPSSSLPPGP